MAHDEPLFEITDTRQLDDGTRETNFTGGCEPVPGNGAVVITGVCHTQQGAEATFNVDCRNRTGDQCPITGEPCKYS